MSIAVLSENCLKDIGMPSSLFYLNAYHIYGNTASGNGKEPVTLLVVPAFKEKNSVDANFSGKRAHFFFFNLGRNQNETDLFLMLTAEQKQSEISPCLH